MVVVIIVVIIVIIALAIYAVMLNKGLNRGTRNVESVELDERRHSMKVSRVSGFIPSKYRAFFDVLKTAMPAQYIILPNIAVELLFQRSNRRELKLEGQYVSFGVFTKDFQPVLVIDLKDFTEATDLVFRLSENEKQLIRNLGIPVMEHEIRDNYSVDELRRAIAKAMNPLYADR